MVFSSLLFVFLFLALNLVSQAALRDLYAKSFAEAAPACRAAMLPACGISGMRLSEDSALLRAWLLDCGYRGMLWGGDTAEGGRVELEKTAIRILRLMLQFKNL